MKTDYSDNAAAPLLACSHQQASTTRCRQRSNLVQTELHKLRPDALNMASVRADLKGHPSRPAEDANDPVLPAFRKRMPQKMRNIQLSPVELKRSGVLSCTKGAKHKDVGRTDTCTQEEHVSLLNTLHPLASPRTAQRSPRTFRRRPLSRIEDEVKEKPSESSLQSPQNSIRGHSVDPPRSAGADCILGMSVTNHSKAREAALFEVVGLPMKLSETAPVSSSQTMKSSRSRPAIREFRRAV